MQHATAIIASPEQRAKRRLQNPVMLARQAAALDVLSGGRMILGLGAGWQEREHRLFGYELGDIPTRFARLEEALEVVTRLLRSDAATAFTGDFFRLDEGATLSPRRPGGPPILIGGSGPKRTLPLVARYADIWNATGLDPDAFRERSAMLDDLLRAAGRRPGDVKRTMMRSGKAEDIVAQIKRYAAAGVEELMLQWFDLDDIEGLRAFANRVLSSE